MHALAAPIIMTPNARAYSIDEIEERLARGSQIEGVTKQDLPTPSLLLDLDAFEANLRRMTEHAKTAGVELRPHAKPTSAPKSLGVRSARGRWELASRQSEKPRQWQRLGSVACC